MDFTKVNEALDRAIKGCGEAETVKALGELKIEVGAAQKEAERIEGERNSLNDANIKLTEALKGQILSTGGKSLPGDGESSQEKKPRTFEEILAEKAKKYNERKN